MIAEKRGSVSVSKGKTLLVDGPASLGLLKGNVRVLGAALKVGEKIVIREGKRMPFEVRRRATFDLTLGENASVEEVEGGTVPTSWENASKDIVSDSRPVTVMVMGGVDSGKTSFCVYLANKALEKTWKVAVIDADLGQSDLGPPSTIGFGHVTKSIKDLFEMGAENAYFVGLTSPSRAVSHVLKGITTLKSMISGSDVDLLIVNTDGWIDGEDAADYKVQLVERIAPDVVVGMQKGIELKSILTSLKETTAFAVESPPAILKRSREKRKILRELGYRKYLKEAKVRAFSLGWVDVEGTPFGTGRPLTAYQMEKVTEALGETPIYGEETMDVVLVVLRRSQRVAEGEAKGIEGLLGKRVMVMMKGEEEGLLVALRDERGVFLGVGVLDGLDYERRLMKVFTPVGGNVSVIQVGRVKLDRSGREIGVSEVFAGCGL